MLVAKNLYNQYLEMQVCPLSACIALLLWMLSSLFLLERGGETGVERTGEYEEGGGSKESKVFTVF